MRGTILLLCLAAAAPAVELRIAAYDGYASPAVVDGFTAWAKATLKTDVHCTVTVLGNNDESYNAIRTGTADVVVATCNMLRSERYKLISGKLVKPLNLAAITNYSDLMPSLQKPDFLTEGGENYGVPMNYGPLNLAYNTKAITTKPTSWTALTTGDQPFAVSSDWPEANVAVAALAAGIAKSDVFNYAKVNTPKVKENLAIMAKKATRKWKGVDDAATLKGLSLATAWGFAFADLAKQGETWDWAEPAEGILGYVDSYTVPAATKDDLLPVALAFIDYSISPAAQALLAKSIGGMSVNPKTKALLTADEAKAAMLDDPTWLQTHLVLLQPLSNRDHNGITKLWDEAQK